MPSVTVNAVLLLLSKNSMNKSHTFFHHSFSFSSIIIQHTSSSSHINTSGSSCYPVVSSEAGSNAEGSRNGNWPLQ